MPTPYQHDSSARATQPVRVDPRTTRSDAAPSLRPVRQTAPAEQPRVISLRSTEIVLPKARIVLMTMVAFALAFLIVHRFSVISDMNYQLGKLTTRYDTLRESNRMLKVDIESAISLDVVREAAATRFGMHEPGQSQLISVNVPKTGYSVVADSGYIGETENLNEDFLTRAVSFLSMLVR